MKADERSRKVVRNLAERYGNCMVVPTFDLYVEGEMVLVLDGDRMVYMNGGHLTDYGAALATERLEMAIDACLRKP